MSRRLMELERRVDERTEQLSQLNQQLAHQAMHDTLTHLPNRALFNDRLRTMLLAPRMARCRHQYLDVESSGPRLSRADRKLLKKYDMPSMLLEMEVTETTIMNDPIRSIEIIKKLVELGVQVSIDDFSTPAIHRWPICSRCW